jgi:hypothetical protein
MILGELRFQAAAAVILGSLLLFTGCGDDSKPTAPPQDNTGKLAPDFSLQDVNSTSASHAQQVSPRDYLEKISAWYFGSAT